MGTPSRTRPLTIIVTALLLSHGVAWAEREYGSVSGVRLHDCHDGDTCTFTIAEWPPVIGDRVLVRLEGIDTPELRGACEEEKALARRARDELRRILARGERIDLAGIHRDKYFRLRARVLVDGQDVGQRLIAAGVARAYSGGTREPWCQ
jgi:endonuclease YncB( thermonuclease family)